MKEDSLQATVLENDPAVELRLLNASLVMGILEGNKYKYKKYKSK